MQLRRICILFHPQILNSLTCKNFISIKLHPTALQFLLYTLYMSQDNLILYSFFRTYREQKIVLNTCSWFYFCWDFPYFVLCFFGGVILLIYLCWEFSMISCNSGWSWTCYIAKYDLNSWFSCLYHQVLKLQLCVTNTSWDFFMTPSYLLSSYKLLSNNVFSFLP